MGFLFRFFLFNFILFLCFLLLKLVVGKVIHKKLVRIFNKKLTYKKGFGILAIFDIYGEGDKINLKCSEISLLLTMKFLFVGKKNSFFNLNIRNLSLEIKEGFDEGNKEKNWKKEKSGSLEKWIFQKIAFYLSIIFVHSINVSLDNIEIAFKDMLFSFETFSFRYERNSEIINTLFEIKTLYLSKDYPYLVIPKIRFNIKVALITLKYFLRSFISDFCYQIPILALNYSNSQLILEKVSIETKVPRDRNVDGQIVISNVEINLPEFDLHTKDFKVVVNDIILSKSRFSTGKFEATRNSGQPLVSFPSMKWINGFFVFDEPFGLYISTPFLIDIGLIKRKVRGVKDPTKVVKTEEELRKQNARMERIILTTPLCNLTIALSDNHILSIPMRKAIFQSMVITAKSFEINVVFPDKKFNFLAARSGELNFKRPNFALKAREADFTLHSEFAELSYITEVFNLFSFVSKQIKGDVSAFRDKQPPTRRKYSFNFESGRVKFNTTELTDKIEAINIAKSDAMRQMKFRQDKAIQILKANNAKRFNKEAFNKESKAQLFKIFKENVSLPNFPQPDKTLFCFDFKNINLVWDGPAIPNREAGMEKLKFIDKNLDVDNVGRIVGGALTIGAKELGFKVRHSGVIALMTDLKVTGWFLNAKAKGRKRNEFFHYRVLCDGNQIEFKIPGVSSRSTNFINFDMHTKSIAFKSLPTLSTIKQDLKLGTDLFRQKKYKFRKIYTFDKIRLRCRWLFSIKSDEVNIKHFDRRNPYSNTPFLDIRVPNVSISFDRRASTLTTGTIFVRIPSPISSTLLLTIPPPTVTFRIVSHNPDNKTNGAYPTFIPIDSYRMTDRTYKPYEEFCTWTYSVHATMEFKDGFVSVNGDLLQGIIKEMINKTSVLDSFISPANHVLKMHPYPTFSFFELDFILPKISVTMNRGKFNVKLAGDPISVKVSTKDQLKVTCHGGSSIISAALNEKELLNVTVSGIDVSTEDMLYISIRAMQGELSADAFSHFSEFNIEMPPPKKKNPLPMLTSEEELMEHFTTPKFKVDIIESSLKIRFANIEGAATLALKRIEFEKRQNDTHTSLNIIGVKEFSILTRGTLPFLVIEDFHMHQASGLSNAIKLLKVSSMNLNFRPDDFDDYIPSIRQFSSEKHQKDQEDNIKHNRNSFIYAVFDKVKLVFHHPDGYEMCNANVDGTSVYLLSNIDKSAVLVFKVQSFDADSELSEKPFNKIFSSSKDECLLNLKIKKAKHIMKRPVIERIEGKLSPFILSISIPFIKNLISIFPSADELQALDIDNDEIDPNMKIDSAIPTELPEACIADAGENGESESVYFCRELFISPCAARFNLRRKDQGAFSEFIARPFNYPGLHMYDIFGTQSQLSRFLKSNLKWTIIKSLPNFLLGKGKKGPPQPKNHLPKAKDMKV